MERLDVNDHEKVAFDNICVVIHSGWGGVDRLPFDKPYRCINNTSSIDKNIISRVLTVSEPIAETPA